MQREANPVPPSRPHVRWMINRDLPEVLAIEAASFEYPWTEDDFIRCLRQRNCVGMVADVGDRVAGYFVYELHKSRLHVLSMAIAPGSRRQGIGRFMVGKLIGKLSLERRSRILLEVRESNLAAQMFFRACGFRAITTIGGYYQDTTEDAYLFEYSLRMKRTASQARFTQHKGWGAGETPE